MVGELTKGREAILSHLPHPPRWTAAIAGPVCFLQRKTVLTIASFVVVVGGVRVFAQKKTTKKRVLCACVSSV